MADRTVSSWGQLVTLRPDSESGPATEERRAWLRYVCDLVTLCRPTYAPNSEPLMARVRNISCGGIQLLVDQPFESGAILSIELPGPAGEPISTLLACVIYAMPQGGGDWAVGCSFVRELSDEDLQPYGARRIPGQGDDRRAWVRFSCDLQATYRIVRVSERKPAPAKVVDISPRGVGLLVNRSIPPGTVLSVDLQGPDGQSKMRMLTCVVRIKKSKAGEWAVGCNFIREISDKEMNALLPKVSQAGRSGGSATSK